MPQMQHECESCDHPTNDILCRFCTTRLVRDLLALAVDTRSGHRRPGLIADLMDTRFKRDNIASASSGASSPGVQPLPFNFAASALLDRARTLMAGYVTGFATVNPQVSDRPSGIAAAAEWLAGHPSLLANYPNDAPGMVDDMHALVGEIRRMVDRAPDRIYLGVCAKLLPPDEGGRISRCLAELYGTAGNSVARCHTCRGEHDAHERWQEIQARVRDSLATAAEIAGAAASLYGRQLNAKTIRTWAERGVITTYGHNAAGVPMHHVGEVFAVATNRPQRTRRTLTAA